MERVCRYCKHYADGECLKAKDVLLVLTEFEVEESEFEIHISNPDNFYCKEWE